VSNINLVYLDFSAVTSVLRMRGDKLNKSNPTFEVFWARQWNQRWAIFQMFLKVFALIGEKSNVILYHGWRDSDEN
jgi:hypothetical protein